MRGLAGKVNLHHAVIQGSYFAGFAAIWGFGPVLLLHMGLNNSVLGVVTSLALLLGCTLMHGAHATCNTYMIHITAKVGAGESLIHVFSSGLGPAVMAVAGGWLMDWGGVNALLIFNTVSALVGAVIVTAATSHYFDKRKARA